MQLLTDKANKSFLRAYLAGLRSAGLERFAPEDLHDLPHILSLLVIQSHVHQWSDQVFADQVVVGFGIVEFESVALLLALHQVSIILIRSYIFSYYYDNKTIKPYRFWIVGLRSFMRRVVAT